MLGAFLVASYLASPERGDELLIPFDFEDRPLLQEALGKTQVRIPERGSRRELIDLAEQNARHLLEEFKLAGLESDERAADPVYDLGRELGLHKIPRSLVCFDMSTVQGRDTVGSLL